MFILTATTFAFGGFAREQICIYACPWPRIQAAMMDEDTLTIGYRDWRGEPRGKQTVEGSGDCIDCMACVNVCPMGIDIRDGQQLACITCGLCIDACDDTMDKIGKPRGLIGYLALTDETRERAGQPAKSVWKHVFRPRTVIYTVLWAGVGIALVVALFLRSPIDISLSPQRNPLYVTLKDGTIRNTYDLRLRNKSGQDETYLVTLTSEDRFTLHLEGAADTRVTVPANETLQQRVYIEAAPDSEAATEDKTDLRLWVSRVGGTERVSHDTVFNGKDD
jgi:cytochrome c oxidase accessory protein FixG